MSKLRESAAIRRREFILGIILDANKCIKVQDLYDTISLSGISITEHALASDIKELIRLHKIILVTNEDEQLLVVPT